MKKNELHVTPYMPTIAALLAVFIWSSLPVASLYTKDVPPFLRTGLGLFFSTLSYIIYWAIRYKGKFLSKLRAPKDYVIFSVLGIFGTNITFLAALSYSNNIEPYIILSTWPIIALFITALIWKEKIKKAQYIGSLFGILGVVLIGMIEDNITIGEEKYISIILALSNAIIWACYCVLSKKFAKVHYDLIGIPLFIIACLSMICHNLFEQSAQLSTENLFIIALMGVGPWGLSHALWGYAMRNGDIKTLFNYGYLVPVMGVTWTIVFGYTTLSTLLITALLCVIAGSMLGAMNFKN